MHTTTSWEDVWSLWRFLVEHLGSLERLFELKEKYVIHRLLSIAGDPPHLALFIHLLLEALLLPKPRLLNTILVCCQ